MCAHLFAQKYHVFNIIFTVYEKTNIDGCTTNVEWSQEEYEHVNVYDSICN